MTWDSTLSRQMFRERRDPKIIFTAIPKKLKLLYHSVVNYIIRNVS